MAVAIEFLALPEEQLEWLKDLIGDSNTWCWIGRSPSHSSRMVTSPGDLDIVSFDSEILMEFDLGRFELGKPVFKYVNERKLLDFNQSLAVQFIPSLILKTNQLTEGQLAISARAWYEDVGIDPAPLIGWYRELSRSWKRLFREDKMVVYRNENEVLEDRYLHLTEGAVKWWEDGGELRTTANEHIKFEVVPRTPRKKA